MAKGNLFLEHADKKAREARAKSDGGSGDGPKPLRKRKKTTRAKAKPPQKVIRKRVVGKTAEGVVIERRSADGKKWELEQVPLPDSLVGKPFAEGDPVEVAQPKGPVRGRVGNVPGHDARPGHVYVLLDRGEKRPVGQWFPQSLVRRPAPGGGR